MNMFIPIRSRSHSGLRAIVSDTDFADLAQYNWFLTGNGYAFRWLPRNGGKKRMELMHRRVLKPQAHEEIDHIDGDKLNNSRENIRVATRTQNQQRATYRHGPSQLRGVRKHHNRWTARIHVNHQEIHLGSFLTAIDAAKAYDKAARLHYGRYALVNYSVSGERTIGV